MNKVNNHTAFFDYPERTAKGQKVPKSRIYLASKASRSLQLKMAKIVDRITWLYKLEPDSLNLPATPDVPQIQIFSIQLKQAAIQKALPEDILRSIDKAIGFPVIFELISPPNENSTSAHVRVAAAYKRPSEAEAGKWVTGDYYASEWQPANTPRSPLPIAHNLSGLYQQIIRQLIPVPAYEGETIAEQAERQRLINIKQRDFKMLESRIQREKQFNRKVELNHKLHEIKVELDALTL